MFHRYRGSLTVLKHHGTDADFASPSSVKVKNEWSYTTTPPIRLNDVHRETLTFIEADII
jgi:hypothetical protein